VERREWKSGSWPLLSHRCYRENHNMSTNERNSDRRCLGAILVDLVSSHGRGNSVVLVGCTLHYASEEQRIS